MKELPATAEYDRVRCEDAWVGVYTDGTPVRLLPQSVSDAMRDELLARIRELKTALVHAKSRAYTELRHRANEAENALDAIATMLGMMEAEAEGTISPGELRRRIEALQCCATCANWAPQSFCAHGGVCFADAVADADDSGQYSSLITSDAQDACHFTPSRLRPRSASQEKAP